ncbi:carboxylesterase family protein [Nocardia sp. NBC_00416]|uniref:carboxylesterase family protein n=1 Tax=Nocardia sp. NBC_00416 TaxID=2975991 RepID=UPI002E1F3AE0
MADVVHLPAGQLRGRRMDGVTAFVGIPYADAERFAAPRPAAAWHGVRDATRPGPVAPQPASRLERIMGPDNGLEQGEDCLSLNVWTPGGTGLPVLVWLHGGGFSSGSGAEAWYDGALLAERGDMVVVTVNYRLGALGYLYISPEFGPANLGLLDQIAALGWVRDNIASFGGDPGRITLAGQSAGALSTIALLHHPVGHGLFHQAILHSLPAGVPPYDTERAASIGRLLLEGLGLDAADVEQLRTVPRQRLLTAQTDVARAIAEPFAVTPPFQLVATDGVPADLIGNPVDGGVPMLIGTTQDEARAFFPDGPAHLTDILFRDGSLQLAGQARSAYTFQFDWSPSTSPFNACHCIELPFAFGELEAWRTAPMLAEADPDDLRRLVDEVQRAWIGFVHSGSAGWERYPYVHHFA